jgi:hypothetical protein
MKKTVRIKENELVNLIDKMINENALDPIEESRKVIRISESKLVSLIENVVEKTKKNKDKETSGFKHWMAKKSGNVVKNDDGTYSTQDAMWKNKIKDLEGLKKYYEKHIK